MNPVISVTEAREILALIPYQIGYSPSDSVVVISLRGPNQRVGVMARVDGGEFVMPDAEGLVTSLIEFLQRDHASQILMVIYCNEDGVERPDWVDAAPRLLAGHRDSFLDTTVWWVSGDMYRTHEPDTGERMLDGWGTAQPTGDITATEVSATMVMRGAIVKEQRADLASLPSLQPEVTHRRWRMGDRWRRERNTGVSATRWREESIEIWASALDCVLARNLNDDLALPNLSDRTWGRMGISLSDIYVRDTVIGLMIQRAVAPDTAVASITSPSELRILIGHLVDPDCGLAPEGAVLRQLCEVVLQVAASTRGKYRSEPLSLLALMAWWEGSGARGHELALSSLKLNANHSLTQLVMQMLDVGFPPGWVMRVET